MPGGQTPLVFQVIQILMLIFEVLTAALVVCVLFRGIVLINTLIKRYGTDKKQVKSKILPVSEKPKKSKVKAVKEEKEVVEEMEELEDAEETEDVIK